MNPGAMIKSASPMWCTLIVIMAGSHLPGSQSAVHDAATVSVATIDTDQCRKLETELDLRAMKFLPDGIERRSAEPVDNLPSPESQLAGTMLAVVAECID